MDHYFPEQTQEIPIVNIPSNSQNTIDNSPNVSQIGLSPILEKVKGVFTPKEANIPLDQTLSNKPSISNLLDDTNALFDDIDENPIDTTNFNAGSPNISWDSIEVNLLNNNSININFKDIWRITKNIHLTTTEGHTIIYSFEDINFSSIGNNIIKFDLTNKVPNILEHFPDVKIKEVLIENFESQFNSIYKR